MPAACALALVLASFPPSVYPADPVSTPTEAAAAPKAGPTLDVFEFDVDGNTVLDEGSIDEALKPFLGLRKTTADIDAARAALEQTYRKRGYRTVYVSIPRQTVRDGAVLLQVTEGRIGHLNVIGSKYHSIDRIRSEIPSLAEGRVPDFNGVQEDLVGLNQQADRRVTPALKAGAAPGTVDVDLVVDDQLPLHGAVELNNRRSRDTSELRTIGTLSYANLWQLGHSLSVSYQTAPQNPSDARVLYGSYLAPIEGSGFSVLFNALKSDSAVATVGGINVIGAGRIFGVRGIYQFPSSDSLYPSLTFGVDYKRFKTLTALSGSSFETPVEYYPFTVGFTGLYRQSSSVTQFDLSVNFASPELGSGSDTIAKLNRNGASGQMLYFRQSLTHTRDLPAGMQMVLRGLAQESDQPLISNEQLSAGGMDSVRGYLEAEALGDYGAGGTFELQSPSFGDAIWPGKSPGPFEDLRLFAFVDGSVLELNHRAGDDPPFEFGLLSAGAGLNMKLLSHLNGVIDWGEPFLNTAATTPKSGRVLFRVWTSF